VLEHTVCRGRPRAGARGGLIDPTRSLVLVRRGCLGCSGDCGGFGGNRCFGCSGWLGVAVLSVQNFGFFWISGSPYITLTPALEI